MKKTLYFFLFILLLTGCKKESTQVKYMLEQAEACMNEYPDSALSVLKSIPRHSLQGKQRADYALLYIQACDKNYIVHTSDSLIQIAVEYYKHKEGELNAAKSYYYLGCVYRDKKDQANAMKSWLKALRYMPFNSTDRTLMLIYNNLASTYNEQGLFKESIEMYKNAYKYSLNKKDTLNIFYSLKGLAHSYLMTNEIDRSLIYSQKAIHTAQQYGNKKWEAAILNNIAKIYLYKKNDSLTAYRYISTSIAKDSSATSLTLKGQLLLGMHQYDSARLCLLKSPQSNDLYIKTRCFHYLYTIERYTNNHALAYAYNDSMQLYMDSIHSYKEYQKIKDLSLSYQLEAERKEWEMQKRIIHYASGGIIIGILLISFAFYQYKGKRLKEREFKQQSQRFDSNIETLNDYLKGHGSKPLEVAATINEHKKNKSQECIRIFQETQWAEKLSYLTPMQEEKYIADTEQTSLYDTLNNIFSYFIADLRREYPTISKEDIHYCLLSMIGYKTKIISYCIKLSTSALRTRKSRMKKKLRKETFEFFFGKDE